MAYFGVILYLMSFSNSWPEGEVSQNLGLTALSQFSQTYFHTFLP